MSHTIRILMVAAVTVGQLALAGALPAAAAEARGRGSNAEAGARTATGSPRAERDRGAAGRGGLSAELLGLAGPLLAGETLSLIGGIASLAARSRPAQAVNAVVVPLPARVELAGATASAVSYVLPAEEAALGALLAQAVGRDYGTTVDQNDLRWIAHQLGVHDVGSMVDAQDVRELVARYRNRLAGPLRWLGRDPGGQVDDDEMRAAAALVGFDVGAVADPLDVDRLRAAIARHMQSQPLTAFATIAGVELLTPSHYTTLVGFHEAAYPVALGLRPTARRGMATLPTRARSTGRQSAADIAVAPGTTVYAPVTGTVVSVEHYALYGKYPDTRIRLVPDANPGLLVTVLHVTGPKVAPGSRVAGGQTPLAVQATQFPFESQIDRFAGRGPHVHIEVRVR